ncbi:MAG: hypothetical protein SFY56_09170 [Bacteroidota bacterium]|nr:hypothetical protein [Bacteroidota bacterium]
MKVTFKHTFFSTLIFLGIIFSCLQSTINYFTKNTKLNSIEISCEDIDDNEDDSESKKIELEDDYFFADFSYSFNQLSNSKLLLFCKQLDQNTPPVITINTPPPKV